MLFCLNHVIIPEVTHFNNFFKKHMQLNPLKFSNQSVISIGIFATDFADSTDLKCFQQFLK